RSSHYGSASSAAGLRGIAARRQVAVQADVVQRAAASAITAARSHARTLALLEPRVGQKLRQGVGHAVAGQPFAGRELQLAAGHFALLAHALAAADELLQNVGGVLGPLV